MKSYIKKRICLLLLLGVSFWPLRYVYAGNFDNLEEAKKGIVEIQAGFRDAKGNFRKMKSGSGFLISNQEGKTYVVTGNRIVRITKKEKENFCNERGFTWDSSDGATVIRIIVKGDVAMETTVLARSRSKDFVILNADNVTNGKEALRLRDDFKWKADTEVYLMAFQQKIAKQQFTESDVKMYTGKIEMRDVNLDREYSFHYSAELPDDYVGGVLLDAEGYVVGIPNEVLSKANEGYRAATSVLELIDVLDNFSIYYDSALKDRQRERLENLYEECMEMRESSQYKEESQEQMQTALEQARTAKETGNASLNDLQDACMGLQEAKTSMVLKTGKIKIMVYILAGVIAGLVIMLLFLLMRGYIEKRKEQAVNKVQKPGKENLLAEGVWRESTSVRKDCPQVLMLEREETGQRFLVKKERTVIGKGEEAGVRIEGNTAISREHALIQYKRGTYSIGDLGSLNGTFVNGRRIMESEEICLRDGDRVRLANERFVIKT